MLIYTVETVTLTVSKFHSAPLKRERVRVARKTDTTKHVEFDASHLPELIKALQEIEPAGTEEWHRLMRDRKARTDGDG